MKCERIKKTIDEVDKLIDQLEEREADEIVDELEPEAGLSTRRRIRKWGRLLDTLNPEGEITVTPGGRGGRATIKPRGGTGEALLELWNEYTRSEATTLQLIRSLRRLRNELQESYEYCISPWTGEISCVVTRNRPSSVPGCTVRTF